MTRLCDRAFSTEMGFVRAAEHGNSAVSFINLLGPVLEYERQEIYYSH